MTERKKFDEKLKEEQTEKLVEVPDAVEEQAAKTQPKEPPQAKDGATAPAADRFNPKPIVRSKSSPEISMPAAARASDLPPSQVTSTDRAPQIEPAGLFRRLAAGAIDGALLAVVSAVLTFIMVMALGTIISQQAPTAFETPQDFLKLTLLSSATPQELLHSAATISLLGAGASIVTALSPLLCIGILFFTPQLNVPGMDPTWPRFLFAWLCLVPPVINLLYSSWMESSGQGGTLGKQMLGISVTKLSGQPVSFNRALARNALKSLSIFTGFIGHFAIAFTPKKQSLHDMLAQCLVVMRSSIVSGSAADQSIPAGFNAKTLKVRKMPLPALLLMSVTMLVLANFGMGLPFEELRAEVFVATAEKLTGTQSALSLSAMRDLAAVYESRGKHASAVNVLKKAIVLARSKYGPADARTLAIEQQLAEWHIQAMDYDQAEPIYQTIAQAMERKPGSDAALLAKALVDYGICLREVKNYPQAIKVFNRALLKNEKLYGAKSRQYADNLYWLACVYAENDQFRESLDVGQQAKQLYDSMLGQNSLEGGYARLWIGRAYLGLKDYDKGEAYLLQSNEALRRGPKGSRRRLIVRHFLANCFRDRGKFEKAERTYEEVIKERENYPGPDKADVYTDYIQFLQMTGRFQEAREFEEYLAETLVHDMNAKQSYKKAEYFKLKFNLARVMERHGKYRQAEELYHSLIDFGASNFGDIDKRVLDAKKALADIYFAEEKYDQAEPLYAAAVKAGENAQSQAAQSDLCQSEYKLGISRLEQGKLKEAELMLKRALAHNEQVYGKLNTNVGLANYRLGMLFCLQGNYKDAERSLLEALHVFESTVGPEDRYVGDTYIWLGRCYGELGSHPREQAMIEHGLKLLQHEAAGYKNQLVGKYFLANSLRDQGKTKQARELYEQLLSELRKSPGPIVEMVQNDYLKLMRPAIKL